LSEKKQSEKYVKGMETRRNVLGSTYVARATANMTEFDKPFQSMITEGAWGTLWSRDNISQRERSMITIALLAALGHHEELALHTRSTMNTGASADDIREALLHVAIYAGVPAANSAFKIVKQVLSENDKT